MTTPKAKFKECGAGKLCPKCKGTSIILNKGSTNFKPIPLINWLCIGCLYEW